MKFLVAKSKTINPGYDEGTYQFFDIICIEPGDLTGAALIKFIKNETRKHAYRAFYNLGASPKTMRREVSHFLRTIPFTYTSCNGSFFAKNVNVWEHSRSALNYIPLEQIAKWGKCEK